MAIRAHRLWQPDDAATLRSREHLLAVWYWSIGPAAGLLLNVPPDRRGLFDEIDAARLAEVRAELDRRFADLIAARVEQDGRRVLALFDRPARFDHLELSEGLTGGQRIFNHVLTAGGPELVRAGTVGVRRWHAFAEIETDRWEIVLDDPETRLESVTAFHSVSTDCPNSSPSPAPTPRRSDARPHRRTPQLSSFIRADERRELRSARGLAGFYTAPTRPGRR